MNLYPLRTRLAYAIIRLTCKYISDSPIRAAHMYNKRTVGHYLMFLQRESENGRNFVVKQSHIHKLNSMHIKSQGLLKALYKEGNSDGK